jgi:hypothetical protein
VDRAQYEERMKQTLVINRSDSRCGACGLNAFPTEPGHNTLAGYSAKPGQKGCGVVWKYVSTDYTDFEGTYDAVRRMRPDLEFWV